MAEPAVLPSEPEEQVGNNAPMPIPMGILPRAHWNGNGLVRNLAAILITFAVTFLVGIQGEHTTAPDSNNYRLIASGHREQAVKPFANRVLDALVVRALAATTHTTPDALFPIVGAIALALIISASAFLLERRWAEWTPWLCIALLCEPWLASLFQQYYFPDLRHAALVSVFFLLLSLTPHLALVPLFLLFLTRESTILLAVCLVGVYALKGRRRSAMLAGGVSMLGLLCQVALASGSQPNVHGINGLLYTLCKIPNNLATNIFGLKFVYNTYSYYSTVHPIAVIDLPRWSVLHNLRQAALVDIDYRAPLQSLMAFLTAFGIAPLVLCLGLKRRMHSIRTLLGLPDVVLVALSYGILSTLAAPTLGNDVPRYLSYAWPMFIVAGAWFVKTSLLQAKGPTLLLCQILLCWFTSLFPLVPGVALALSLQYWAFRTCQCEPLPVTGRKSSRAAATN